MGVTDYCALYFRLRGLQAPTRHEMTISDLQLIVNVAMWTAEPGECTRSETVFTEVLHGAQASIAIPDDEIEQSGDLGYKWTVPGGRLLELPASLAPPGGSDLGDRYQEQLAQLNRLARDGENNFDKQPPPWAAPEYAEERVGKRTWVLSVTAFRPSDQKTAQLMRDAKLNLDWGDPDDFGVRFLSWEHTPLKAVTASHERPPHDGEGHLHGHLRPPATADGSWQFHLHFTTMEGGQPWARGRAEEELTEALKHVPWV